MDRARGIVIAAPGSGSGKTVVTLALLGALSRRGVAVAALKVGPDYIDPGFHAAAAGRVSYNLDLWAMRPATVAGVLEAAEKDAELVLAEGVMGLFDGAGDGQGSTADLAALTGWPVLLVVDARGVGASAAALIEGFQRHRADVPLAGVLFNRVGSARHERVLRGAVPPGLPVLGALPGDAALALPERHLGLVQASENRDLAAFLTAAADLAERHVDLARLRRMALPARLTQSPGEAPGIPPLGRRIAVAQDRAFAFAYPALLEGWRRTGAEVRAFSPLADEAPDAAADAVYLPGGYPELHAARLASNRRFMAGLAAAALRGAGVLGECGGYMVLGRGLVDADGVRHPMAGLLPLESSFARRRLHLGYRSARLLEDCPLGAGGEVFRGHEFHYASIVDEGPGEPLFHCRDAEGSDLGPQGRRRGNVLGSFVHLIDRAA